MSKRKVIKTDRQKHKPSQKEVNDALAALIANTKRKSRKLNPLEVVEKIQIAYDGIGSLPKVADRIGLSYEMLRQIFSIRGCSEQVKKLVTKGKLDSYDILHRLSKLTISDQNAVAKAIVVNKLNSADVRAIVTHRKDIPKSDIAEIISRIKSSRNIKHFIAYFTISPAIDPKSIRSHFVKAFGNENIVSMEIKGDLGKLVLTVEGKKRFQTTAKRKSMTKRELIQDIVLHGVK